jgi:GT2 family glycosyltransferase
MSDAQKRNWAPDAAAKPLVSIVILTYGSTAFIGPCLRSVARSTWSPLEIVIADNASADQSLEIARKTADELQLHVHFIPLQRNLGCAGGNNAGWRASKGEVLIFLNPDTELAPNFVTELVRPLLADSSIGITGAKMYYPDSRILQHAGGIVFPNGMTSHIGMGEEDRGQFDERTDVDYVTGAGFAIRRELIEQLGGFDEEYYPAYYEEVDLCMRTRKSGKRVVYVPSAVMTHHESVSLGSDSPALRLLYPRMRIRFCLKNYSVLDLVRHFVPYELHWLIHEPQARGYRVEQFLAYAANWKYLLRKLLGRNRAKTGPGAVSKLA